MHFLTLFDKFLSQYFLSNFKQYFDVKVWNPSKVKHRWRPKQGLHPLVEQTGQQSLIEFKYYIQNNKQIKKNNKKK